MATSTARRKVVKQLRCHEGSPRWSPLLFLSLILVVFGIVNGTEKRSSSQALDLAERLEAEQRLADLGYWGGPIDGIHGSPLVAVYPASHGCIRIPMFAAKGLSELVAVGTEVFIYQT